MPRCICKNCKHCKVHTDGKVCGKHLVFVHEDDTCEGFETNEMFNPTNLTLFTIACIAIVYLLLKIL